MEDRSLWELWAAISLRDLKRAPGDLLADFPRKKKGDSKGYAADLLWLLESFEKGGAIRINCGGDDYQGKDGKVWTRDRFYRSGYRRGEPAGLLIPFSLEIQGTEDDFLYQTERFFPPEHLHPAGYRLPISPGRYQVSLHFAETSFRQAGKRVLGALLEGREVLLEHEPLKAGFATAERKSFPVEVQDGLLDIELLPWAGAPSICALEIEPAAPQ